MNKWDLFCESKNRATHPNSAAHLTSQSSVSAPWTAVTHSHIHSHSLHRSSACKTHPCFMHYVCCVSQLCNI